MAVFKVNFGLNGCFLMYALTSNAYAYNIH